MGYSPRGCKESDTTERLHLLTYGFFVIIIIIEDNIIVIVQSCLTLCDPMV